MSQSTVCVCVWVLIDPFECLFADDATEPTFALEPTAQVLIEGETCLLECLANGVPQPEVRWLKEDKAVHIDNDRIRIVGASSLHIAKLVASDAGTYTCRATNAEDSIDASASIQVKGMFYEIIRIFV
jgi:hypothetical protein